MMELHVLGSGGFMPFPDAHMPGFLIRYEGKNYIFDAGEGTQTRMVEEGLSRADLEAVFISHLHGDHVLGLPGLLIRRSQEGNPDRPVFIFGPEGLQEFLDNTRETLGYRLIFESRFRELFHGRIISLDRIWVGTVELDHRVETYGFAIGPRHKKRKFHPDQARELGVPEGPMWGKLQEGTAVELEDGTVVEPDEVSDPPEAGPKVVYLPDTRPIMTFPEGFREPDILIHEGMFLDEHRKHAIDKKHSTAREAARVAEELNAGKLLLTHRSRRYTDEKRFLDEARDVFAETELARDGQEFIVG